MNTETPESTVRNEGMQPSRDTSLGIPAGSDTLSIQQMGDGIRRTPTVLTLLSLLALQPILEACGHNNLEEARTLDGGRFGKSTVGDGWAFLYSEASLVQRGYPVQTLRLQLRHEIMTQLSGRITDIADGEKVKELALANAEALLNGATNPKDGLIYMDLLVKYADSKGIAKDALHTVATLGAAGMGLVASFAIADAEKESAEEGKKGQALRRPDEQNISLQQSQRQSSELNANQITEVKNWVKQDLRNKNVNTNENEWDNDQYYQYYKKHNPNPKC